MPSELTDAIMKKIKIEMLPDELRPAESSHPLPVKKEIKSEPEDVIFESSLRSLYDQ